jgi:hypothetical protein
VRIPQGPAGPASFAPSAPPSTGETALSVASTPEGESEPDELEVSGAVVS